MADMVQKEQKQQKEQKEEKVEQHEQRDPSPVSVLLLARDETRDLEELIPRLSFAREVVVVWDPRGDPATRETAVRLGASVYSHAFAGFGAQRTHALSHCSQPWVLWLDADERLDAAAVAALRAAAASRAGGPVQYALARATWFLGRRIRFCGWQGERIVRFFLRDRARFDDAEVHETVHVDGPPPVALAGLIEHHSYRTFEDCVSKCVRYASAGAAKAERRGQRAGPLDVMLRPPLRFLRQYVLQLGFLDGPHGLVLCGFAAVQVYLKYAELWQRTRSGSRG
jgi:(heptosyl)LPS beta-1,4-glucosyltransferase